MTDLLLWTVYLTGACIAKKGSRGIYEAASESNAMLEKFNHHTIASIWHVLTKKKLITYNRRNNLYNSVITDFGKKRLDKIIPVYDQKRPWDGKIYLITYDILESAHNCRNKFRKYLKDLGCKKLQESVWLNPYNIRELLCEFVLKYKIPGTIIVSDIGKDGGIGVTTIQDLLVKLYSLEKLNDRYDEFIDQYNDKSRPVQDLLFQYYSILNDDPQLPFELLPKNFSSGKAYEVFLRLLIKCRLSPKRPDIR